MFGRKMKEGQTTTPGLSGRLGERIERKLHRAAAYLNSRLRQISPAALKLGLGLFVLAMSASSFFCIKTALEGSKKPSYVIVAPIRVPKHRQSGDRALRPGPLTRHDYNRFLFYERLLDSLKERSAADGDSLLPLRPGLSDTLRPLKRLYEESKLK